MSVNPKSPEVQSAPMTVEEYLTLERETQTKYEYHAGWVTAQAGGSVSHAKLSSRVGRSLGNALEEKGADCEVYNSDAKLAIPTMDSYVYPDVMVVCGPEETSEENRDAITNPIVLVEVLSPSTEAYDRGEKFEKYRKIPSLQEYVLILQDKPAVEVYTRLAEENSWRFTTVSGLEEEVTLVSLGVTISLAWLYRHIDFGKVSSNQS
ncbi:MAG TPA: Uma2 family endonuclease [Cytophagales bacterium]|nr:Uma2 family endonuclease [Cytophagales bacterium]HAA22554.1 Uma2 family endonuclease [Cytophagales bacterium]HAP59809.1 Uma2 family endonuclease [Cytophagales bacterium]